MALAVRGWHARQSVRQPEGIQPGLAWEALVGRVDQKDHAELETLRLVDAEHVHLLVRGLEVRGDGIVPRLAEELEVRDEERRAIRRERPSRALHQTQELRDVPRLLLHES